MGCSSAKPAPEPQKKGRKDTPAEAAAKAAAAERRKNLNPLDFIVSKRHSEVVIKKKGEIMGEQFNIEECKDCDIFLFDHIATAFIDECSNCRIYVGPVETSVMLRNCESCSLVVACQQFRTRDCKDCQISLLCTTEPIIETSSDMRFACFDFAYFDLKSQLELAKVKIWNNKWWQVYDFNKTPDRPNWSFLPQEEARKLLRVDHCSEVLTHQEVFMDRVVPVTLGSQERPHDEACFLLFLPNSEADVEGFVGKATEKHWIVCRTRCMVLTEDRLKQLFDWARESSLRTTCKGKEVTGIEVCGLDVDKQVREAVAEKGITQRVRIVPQQETSSLARAFFEGWREEI